MDLNKEEGFEIGAIAEKKFEERCNQNRVVYSRLRNFNNWTNVLDKVNGDYVLLVYNKFIRIDVKGGAISLESILRFKGDYFVIFENSNESASEGLVFNPVVLKNLVTGKKKEYFDSLALSNQPGILYSRLIQLKNNAAVSTISHFFKSFDS